MKKLFYFVLPALLIVFSLNSCTKENTDNPTDTISESSILSLAKTSDYRQLIKIVISWGNHELVDYRCSGSGGNCLPDVVVTAMSEPEYNNFKGAVDTGTEATYFSSDDYKALIPDLANFPDVIKSLIKGDSKISKLQNESIDDKVMFFVYPANSHADSTNFDRFYQIAIPVNE